jgi:predicted TIM-barrel fold metal-dependent hydrolase
MNDNNFAATPYKDKMPVIFDAHFHIGKYTHSFVNTGYENDAIEISKSLGVKKIFAIHTAFLIDLELGLEESLKFLKKYPGFAIGALVYNPNHIEKSINIIERWYGKDGFAGVKMHPEDHDCPINDERYKPLWKIAEDKGIPVLSHTWNPNVPNKKQKNADALLFEEVINRHPGLKIILGHAGAKDGYYREVVKMLKRQKEKNMYVDLAGDIFYNGMIELFVKEAGSGKILFGTDIPWTDPVFCLASVLNSDISETDRENIFFNNAADLFNL